MIRVAIVGATGYTAVESLKILLRHREAEVTFLSALPEECGKIEEIFPVLTGRLDLEVEPLDVDKMADRADVVLGCLPHKVSMAFVPKLLAAGVKVVDFSADYRFPDAEVYEKWYAPHTDAEHLSEAVYGLPELFRDQIPPARLIANPGCYPTCCVLGLAPLVKAELIGKDPIINNAVSGISGAGRKPSLLQHFPERNENYQAYAVGGHRHQPEMEYQLQQLGLANAKVLFQPHLAPMDRGILSSLYVQPTGPATAELLGGMYREFYADEPFVRVLNRPPTTKDVSGTNFCDIYPAVSGDMIVIFSVLDNLIKGAAGQAIQNMNLIFGLAETEGLL